MQGFTFNGRRMNGTNVADDELVPLGTSEIWDCHNRSMMPYPIDVHTLAFGVVGRRGRRPNHRVRAGLVDERRRHAVLPGERIRIARILEDIDGLSMGHQHRTSGHDKGSALPPRAT